MTFKTLEYRNRALWLLDQTLLPDQERMIECRSVEDVIEAIQSLRVRGAPAIGCAGGYGVVVAAVRLVEAGATGEQLTSGLLSACERIASARPTAVNLSWAVQRMERLLSHLDMLAPDEAIEALRAEADRILEEDAAANRSLGAHGASLVPNPGSVLTHCNAGALATGEYGTALGVVRAAHERGTQVHVWVDETRPLLQGARLTAWELDRLGIPYSVITDSMAGHVMARETVDVVVVGADRIAANGDTANKIGTYSVAVLANAHGIPFYVAAPTSTVDLNTPSGSEIPIEQRRPDEVTTFRSLTITPKSAPALNPAFDVTPAALISGIITEVGVVYPPFDSGLAEALERACLTGKNVASRDSVDNFEHEIVESPPIRV